MIFSTEAQNRFKQVYLNSAAMLRHGLAEHPLLALETLADFVAAQAEEDVEYNSGDLPIGHDPALTPPNLCSAAETVRNIAAMNAWAVIKNIERNPAYSTLLDACLQELETIAASATAPMLKKQGYIFVSSPHAVTPFHMDPEHNILMQLRGVKTLYVLPGDKGEVLSQNDHEAFHRAGGHRNLPFYDDYEARALKFVMAPGDAVYVPVKTPHWVRVGEASSVSLSLTWRTPQSEREALLHQANAWLRARGGAPPKIGASALRDRCVILARRLAMRIAR